MKINKIQINGYGKLKDTTINLEKGINIIYGKNEAGKSTLLNYITSSFYGISKNKKGKEISDFERYAPWDDKEFSGKINYELNNGEVYEVFRDFRKKNPKIYNKNMEDISKQFNIDKTKGNEFFYEQTKIDEDLFKSTFLANQQEVKLENKDQHMLIQKISNLVGTGEDNVSYKIAMDRLKRRQLEEVGSERSREKPINILTREIDELENEKKELKSYESIKYEIEENKNEIYKEIEELENKNNVAKEIRSINKKEELEKEKIKIQENLEKENENKISKLKEDHEEIREEIENEQKINIEKNKKIERKKKKLNKKTIAILAFLLLLNILQFIFLKNKYLNYILLLTIIIPVIIYVISKNKLTKKASNINQEKENELKNKEEKIENEINILKQNNMEVEEKIERLINDMKAQNTEEKRQLRDKYKNISEVDLDDLFMEKDIEYEIEKIQNLINDNKIKIHQLDLDKQNIEPKLDNLAKLEEKLEKDKNKFLNIKDKEKSIELAKKVLTNAYEKMKQEVTPKFTKQLSKNIAEITKNKYSKAMYNDEKGLIVELDNGEYIPANKLSLGTIDQLYMSLRLSMIDDLSEETLPIILDESFAYYDNNRLENILKYLSTQFSKRQIIIFTCTKREKETLEKNNISFNFIKI